MTEFAPTVPQKLVLTLEDLERRVGAAEVTDPSSLAYATELLTRLSVLRNETERARVTLVKPLNDHVKLINDTFRPRQQHVVELEKQLKRKFVTYHQERERAASEAQARADLEAEAGKAPEVAVERPRTSAHTTGGSAQVKKTWTYEVTSFAKIPDEFKELNRGAVRAAINGGEREVPGLRIFQEHSVAVTRNRQ